MQASPNHPLTSQSQRMLRFVYLLSAALCVYALLTIGMDARGMLNFATWLAIAGLTAGIAALSASSFAPWTTACAWARRHQVRLPLLMLALGLGLLASLRYALRLWYINGDFQAYTVILWVAAWICLLAAVWPHSPIMVRPWVRAHRLELLGITAVTLLGAALRWVALGAIPDVINGDEGMIGLWAQDIGVSSGVLTTPFAAMDGVGTLYLAIMKGVIILFGATPFALRLLPALAGALALPATHLLARRLVSRRAAWVALALLTVSHVHIHFSRTVAVSYIYATLFVPLALYFLISGLEQRSPFRLVLSVLMVGLHINIYVDAWVWLVLLFLLLGAWTVIDRQILRGNGINLALFALALLIIITPMVIWGIVSPDAFSSRLAVDGTFSSGWLAEEARTTGKSPTQIVLDLFILALTTFYQRPFQDFYGIGVPTLDPIARYLWVLGLALALLRTWDRRMITLNGWFWGGVVALGVVTIPPSTYHYRLLVVLPAACILVGLATDWILGNLEQALWPDAPQQSWRSMGLIGVLALALAYLNLTTYFSTFAPTCMYSGPRTRQASLLGSYLSTLPHTTQVRVLSTDSSFQAGPYLSVDFLSQRMAVGNIREPLTTQPPEALITTPGQGLAVVAVSERRDELEQVRAWFPGGQETVLADCGRAVLSIYYWSP